MTLPSGRAVRVSTDAGHFYCNHMLWAISQWAAQPDSSVGRNAHGEPLIGFLHVPGDDATTVAGSVGYARKQAQSELRSVVGAAVLGLVAEAVRAGVVGPVRVLLTGYGNWGLVTDNPTAAFVRGLRGAMGPLQLRRRVFGVTDTTIDGGALSVQALLARLRPHVVVALGVAVERGDFCVEVRADDSGLHPLGLRHLDHAPARVTLADNFAIARAILHRPDHSDR